MKFRRGFVTNSSSSSFICQICGSVESGWDMSAWEAGFVECENGHEFCQEHMVNVPGKDDDHPWSFDYDYFFDNEELVDGRYDLPAKYCPICQMQNLNDRDLIDYVATKGMTRKVILEEIRHNFKTYDEFVSFLKDDDKQ